MPVCQIAAALSPLHHGEDANALLMQPGIFLARGEIDIGFRPATRPQIFFPVKSSAAQPILPGQFMRIMNAQSPLLRRVDQEQPPKGPERLPTKRCLWLLIQHYYASSRVNQLRGSHQARQASANNDRISITTHYLTPISSEYVECRGLA